MFYSIILLANLFSIIHCAYPAWIHENGGRDQNWKKGLFTKLVNKHAPSANTQSKHNNIRSWNDGGKKKLWCRVCNKEVKESAFSGHQCNSKKQRKNVPTKPTFTEPDFEWKSCLGGFLCIKCCEHEISLEEFKERVFAHPCISDN